MIQSSISMVWKMEFNVLVEFGSPLVHFSFVANFDCINVQVLFSSWQTCFLTLAMSWRYEDSSIILAIISYVYLKFIGTKLPIILIIQISEPLLLYIDVPSASAYSMEAVLRLLRNPDWEPREQSLIFCLFLDSKSWDVGFTVKGGFLLSFE